MQTAPWGNPKILPLEILICTHHVLNALPLLKPKSFSAKSLNSASLWTCSVLLSTQLQHLQIAPGSTAGPQGQWSGACWHSFSMTAVIVEKGRNPGGTAVGENLLRQNSWKKLLSLETWFVALIQGSAMLKLEEKDYLEETVWGN